MAFPQHNSLEKYLKHDQPVVSKRLGENNNDDDNDIF